MSRGLGAIYKTNKCTCDNPKWNIISKRKISSGKQFGKTSYLLSCLNCRKQWETSAKYAEELEMQ